MFTSYDKAIVALVGAVLFLVQWYFEVKTDFITEDQLATVIAAITPALVWLVPNKKPEVVAVPAPAPVETPAAPVA